MKQLCVVLTVLVLTVAFSATCAEGAHFGLKGGAGIGWVTGGDWDAFLEFNEYSSGLRIPFSVGAFFDLPLAPFLSIQPEFLYSRFTGGYVLSPESGLRGTLYGTGLDIPILLKPKIRQQSGYLYFLAGPDIFLIIGQVHEKLATYDGKTELSNVAIDPDNELILGVVGGLGYAFDVSGGELNIEIRYVRTFTPVFEGFDQFFSGVIALVGVGLKI